MLKIKAERMGELEKFGFVIDKRFIYPKSYTRQHGDFFIKINFGEKCINVWDLEDKNAIGEIWVWKDTFGFAKNKIVKPYIQDLITADMVEEEPNA